MNVVDNKNAIPNRSKYAIHATDTYRIAFIETVQLTASVRCRFSFIGR